MENQYNIRHAREILEPAAPAGYLLFDDNGVWPGEAVKKQDEQDDAEFLRWRPADHLQHRPDATEPASTPMLPNPFNARELAAFMLGGTGAWVRCEYGEWADGPSQERLNRIDRQSYARRALIEAYAAYREAERVVGSYPSELAAVADRAREAYNIANMEANLREGVSDSIPGTEDSRVRRERAKSSIAALDSEMEAANEAAQIASETWLTAMVVCLLEKPQAAAEAPAVAAGAAAQEQTVATPVVQAKARSRTWWDISAPYIVGVMKEGQYATAKELFRALEKRAGTESPFDKGSGNNKGSLYVREIAQSLSCKTVQNNWGKLRELAQTQAP